MTTLDPPILKDLRERGNIQLRRVPGTDMVEVHGVRGFLLSGDVQCLWAIAEALPPGGTHVEIGSWMGLSSVLFASALIALGNETARVYCIDTWQGSEEHREVAEITDGTLYETFLENIRRTKVAHMLRPLRGDSAPMAREFADGTIDSVFVDGDHSYEGCLRDIQAWLPKLRASGRMLGHDATPGGGVRRAVDCVAAKQGYGVRYYAPPTAHYIWEFVAK